MLDIAQKYESELQLLFLNITYDLNYQYYMGVAWQNKFKCFESNYNDIEMVSKDMDNKVIGYIRVNVDRASNTITGMSIINFYSFNKEKSKERLIFGRDVVKFIDDIFNKYKFRKIRYAVCSGNPIESTYDKLTDKYGGRIVGYYLKEDKLLDGEYHDYKMYELFAADYLKRKYKKSE